MDQRYALALRPERRTSAPADWQQQVRAIVGVMTLGASQGHMLIAANDTGLAQLRNALGSFLHIEPLIQHSPG
jgi:hypothetical protein